MSKKAFTMQFHWIFVLVAGAIILAFFFSLVQKQRVLSQEKLSITLATDIEAVFSGAIESKGTAQPLVIPRTGIAFSCSQACQCNFVIGNKATDFRDKIIFAPDLIEDQDAIAWAQEFKMPFRITNFLYLTNPNIKYYIVYNPSIQKSQSLYRIFEDSLPPGLNIATLTSLNLGSVLYEGFQETKFVFLDVTEKTEDIISALEGLNSKFKKEIVSAVSIHSATNTVYFYEKEKKDIVFTEKPSFFIAESSVFAAMFASDKIMYECGIRAAFSRMVHVAQVVHERANIIQNEMQVNRSECIYNLQALADIVSSAKTIAAAPQAGVIASVIDQKATLERENRNIIQLSCPEIY